MFIEVMLMVFVVIIVEIFVVDVDLDEDFFIGGFIDLIGIVCFIVDVEVEFGVKVFDFDFVLENFCMLCVMMVYFDGLLVVS